MTSPAIINPAIGGTKEILPSGCFRINAGLFSLLEFSLKFIV